MIVSGFNNAGKKRRKGTVTLLNHLCSAERAECLPSQDRDHGQDLNRNKLSSQLIQVRHRPLL